MPDTPKPAPTLSAIISGVVFLALFAFIVFGASALGWHAGLALARVIGL